MKYFLIRYRFKNGSAYEWHQEIARFISDLENDPALKGKVSYRSMKVRDSDDYYHLATAADDEAVAVLGAREFFVRYTEKTELVAGGNVEVSPLEMIAETKQRA